MLLIAPEDLAGRRAAAAGPLAPLADSLAAELDRLLPSTEIFVPAEKAKLTRAGGRCPRDASWLEFDPREPRRHRCPACGTVYDGEAHYRWWVMGYQLWLAERAALAATLWALRGAPRHRAVTEGILSALGDAYLGYPNADNVLGPARPFFSTYLESIWLLQLAIALDILEQGTQGSLGGRVRERLLEPSVRLIRSYREGRSNRQVWSSAALAAAGTLLSRPALVEEAIDGDGGLVDHLRHGVLRDGTWYEGENYHLFAHRGLWYLVTMAARLGAPVAPELLRVFDEGFATPFLTALPDFTFPARRDSPYAVSLRQWRIAESAELGAARSRGDDRLAAALAELYREDVSAGDTGRWKSTAEAERNVPGARLTRADLGWKSLWSALPAARIRAAPRHADALLEGQGFAVWRRAGGRVFVALDYGHSGGGHGHPDRLNLWLVDGATRVLEDVGTGSYVERTLHWYRSTLAHNAPLIDGRSQDRVTGELRAWDAGVDVAWIEASAAVAAGVVVRRSVVVAGSYLIDRLEWRAERDVTLDLPIHVGGEIDGAIEWTPASLPGSGGLEDGFDFVSDAETAGALQRTVIRAKGATAWVFAPPSHAWYRAAAPGPPGTEERRFFLVRATGTLGVIDSVWSWDDAVLEACRDVEEIMVRLRTGATERHRHDGDGWVVDRLAGERAECVRLAGRRPAAPARHTDSAPARAIAPYEVPALPSPPSAAGDLTNRRGPLPLQIRLSREHYRRSEDDWRTAGGPEALVALGTTGEALFVEVTVRKAGLSFAPSGRDNPLDNEHPDVNSDGVQLHLAVDGDNGRREYRWLAVPEEGGASLRITPRVGEPPVSLSGEWRPTRQGYQVLLRIPRAGLAPPPDAVVWLDVAVNETAPGRERRRGQLALSAEPGEWVYLRGDRSDPRGFRAFHLADA